ncbi:acylneuraminate cytidylyltransferase family protein [Candidatus Pseudothioglobus singularis]|nr:acylneuraminate cytidylyltransferase family protein [Candidatus Pseudothioglobus singularis]
MKRICSICARGGSKGVVNKNIRMLMGKPLIAHTILQAREANCFDLVVVSSDSLEILNISKEWGADMVVERPADLASDHSAKFPAIKHCIKTIEKKVGYQFDTIVDLDATSPLRIIDDIHNSLKMIENSDSANNLVTGSPSRRSPYFNLVELNKNGFVNVSKSLDDPVIRRQDSPECFDLNASIYIWKRKAFYNTEVVISNNTSLYVMPEERSIDIDSELDFEIVTLLIKNRDLIE